MYLEKLKELVQEGVTDKAFPGATYAIVLPDAIYTDFVGDKSWYPNVEPNTIDTIYDMASVTKVMTTTTCILKLLEFGKVRLFSKVSNFLPRFKHQNIVLWHLLTHTSGLREGLPGVTKIKSSEEAWDKAYDMELIYEPGTKIQYSDVNYILLGKIIEVVSGLSLDEFAKKYIYEPCEMKDTCFNPKDIKRCAPTEERNDEIVQGIVRGHVHDEAAYILGGVAGHAGMFSTANDVANFIQMILNKGVFKNKRVLSGQIVDLLYKPQVAQQIGVSLIPQRRGIGWIVNDYNSNAGDLVSDETITHTGFTGTNVWIDRINQVGFCLLSNRVHPTRANLKHMELRPKVANYIMAHLEEIKKEIQNGN